MYEADKIEHQGPKVTLVSATPQPLAVLAATFRMYEGKSALPHEMSKDDMLYIWEQQMKTHLKAPLEFIDFQFLIEGVTRGFTHQLVRQRTAVFAQESMRFAVKENMADEIELPPSIRPNSEEAARWRNAIQVVSDTYRALVANGVPAEDARGLAPTAVRTKVHYKTNLRNLLEHVGMRLCTQAQFEWRIVISQMVNAIYSYHTSGDEWLDIDAWQFQHIAMSKGFKPICFAKGGCVFEADQDRMCKIRDRMNNGESDKVLDGEWLLDIHSARPTPKVK